MTKRIFNIFSFFALIIVYGCCGLNCNYSLYKRQLKERMKSPNCIKVYDTIDNWIYIQVIDTLTGELLGYPTMKEINP